MSESFILRTYPYREGDLIVSFFTRDQGKLRGIARRARKPKSQFGAGLERLSHVAVSYYQKESRELVNLNSCELVHSQFALAAQYEASVALDFMAEISDHLLNDGEAHERHFRLLIAVLEFLRGGGNVWQAIHYFGLWSVRLAGFLPALPVSGPSLLLADEMLSNPITTIAPREWTRDTAADLRRFLQRKIEEHVERKLRTPALLESL